MHVFNALDSYFFRVNKHRVSSCKKREEHLNDFSCLSFVKKLCESTSRLLSFAYGCVTVATTTLVTASDINVDYATLLIIFTWTVFGRVVFN